MSRPSRYSVSESSQKEKSRLPGADERDIIHSVDATLPFTEGARGGNLSIGNAKVGWKTRIKRILCCFCQPPSFYNDCARQTVLEAVPHGHGAVDTTFRGHATLGPAADDDIGKITLFLDLDETLVHSSFKPVDGADFFIPVEIAGGKLDVYVIKRPWLEYFLEQVSPHFEVVVFTASLSKYADPVIDLCDKNNRVRHRLYREGCCPYGGNYVKDLNGLGRDLQRCILVDNSPHSYLFQPENALPIQTFIDDPEDCALLDILPILLRLKDVDDVRKHLIHLHD